MLPTHANSYAELIANFQWRIPEKFNIATAVCDQHAAKTPQALALIEDREGKPVRRYTFAELKTLSDQLAASFAQQGIQRGDRIAMTLDQGMEALVSLIACFKLGAIAVPIAPIYGTGGMAYRISDSGAKWLLANENGWAKIGTAQAEIPDLERVIIGETAVHPQHTTIQQLLQQDASMVTAVDTNANDPAIIFYTSGSTGPAKGVLHAHRVLLGHIPGFQMFFNLAPQPNDIFWTPSVWAWLGSLGDLLLPALYFGYPVVATPGRFSVQKAYHHLEKHQITCPFLATSILRRMHREPPSPEMQFNIRAIGTGGELVSPDVYAHASTFFNAPVNDDFGLSEGNEFAAGCTKLFKTPRGAIGLPVPGRTIAILGLNDQPLPAGKAGEIAMHTDDPILMLGYWNQSQKTAVKLANGWLHSGDLGYIDADGFLYYQGRLDDMIRVGGVNVGPEEVEMALLKETAVKEVCVVGVPDEERGQLVTAFIRPQAGCMPSESLIRTLQQQVKHTLAGHAYPRRIIFVTEFPITATGKIQRTILRNWAEANPNLWVW